MICFALPVNAAPNLWSVPAILPVHLALLLRHVRRQAKREFKMDMTTACRVVNWRKPPAAGKGSGDPEATGGKKGFHAVQGHFRLQPYKSEGVVPAIFIAGHFRGQGETKLPRVNYVRR